MLVAMLLVLAGCASSSAKERGVDVFRQLHPAAGEVEVVRFMHLKASCYLIQVKDDRYSDVFTFEVVGGQGRLLVLSTRDDFFDFDNSDDDLMSRCG